MEEDYTPLALEAVLLFHSGSEWNDEKRARWREITFRVLKSPALNDPRFGTAGYEATTKVLCDLVRAAIEQQNRQTTQLRPGLEVAK